MGNKADIEDIFQEVFLIILIKVLWKFMLKNKDKSN